jgi:predicted phage terminase large subunit-like protein
MGRKPTEELTKGKLHRCFYDLTHTDVMERASVNAICIVVDRLLAEYYDEYHRTVFKHTAKWKDQYEDIMANYKIYEEEYVQRAYANWLDIMLLEARNRNLDSYFLMLEWARPKRDRFYEPRRVCLRKSGIVKGMQDLLDDKLDILSISMPPGVGKTSCLMFFLTGVMGWFPNDFNLFYSHSGDIVKMFYRGCLDIITNDTEYQWNKIFPKLKVERTDAGLEQINVGKFKTFPSLQTTSVGSKNAGKVRASKFLCVDDMISGIDEALNKNTLDKLWNNYSVDARQRKLDGAKEIHIATRWSVHDVIGRLQRIYEGNPRARFIAVPDIDPETGESNFDYDNGLGFSVDFFNDQALTMDDISYRCLYKQEPIEREGLLYHEDDLRRFDSLPLREPDAIWGICDTKTTGTDFMFMPILYQYDNDYYCWDCICDNSANIGVLQERLAVCLVENKVQQCEFESNAGGAAVAFEVKKKVDKMGGHCNITTKPTETNKETRIIVESDWIKQHVLFKQNFILKSDYSAMMGQLLSYSIAGKNVHDDVPDGFSNFSRMIRSKLRRHETEIIRGGLFA